MMFPTHVGMNRSGARRIRQGGNVPHTRGDEPVAESGLVWQDGMFPTHVGMNRGSKRRRLGAWTCSPHTWG